MSAAEHRLYFLLQRTAHSLKKASDRLLTAAGGVTTAQAAVLALVSETGPLRQREVAARLGLNESAVTAMVGRLLEAGYVERRRSEKDNRAWRLRVSRKGREALAGLEEPFGEINAVVDSALSGDEIASLSDYLRRILDALDDG